MLKHEQRAGSNAGATNFGLRFSWEVIYRGFAQRGVAMGLQGLGRDLLLLTYIEDTMSRCAIEHTIQRVVSVLDSIAFPYRNIKVRGIMISQHSMQLAI